MTLKKKFLNGNGHFFVIGIAFDDVFQRIIVDSTQLYLCLYVLSDDFDQNNPKISQKLLLCNSSSVQESRDRLYFWAKEQRGALDKGTNKPLMLQNTSNMLSHGGKLCKSTHK